MTDDKPLDHLAETERTMDQPEPEVVAETEMAAHDRLRAFEDAVLGPEAPRHDGKPEMGSGSVFASLPDEHKAHHAALLALIEAEAEHQKASAAEEAAHAKLEAAINRVNETEPK